MRTTRSPRSPRGLLVAGATPVSTSLGRLAGLLLCAAGLWACGSTAAWTGADGGSVASSDGGGAGTDDGGVSAADGGSASTDGGGADGGNARQDGGAPDGGSAVVWKIRPGEGLDVADARGNPVSLRVGQTYGQVRALVGDGADSPLFAGAFDRVYNGGYFVFFANTDQSNDGASTPNNTFTDPDVMRYVAATQLFLGKTPGGTGPGSQRSEWLAELGQPDLTQSNLEVAGETRDLYFTRGLVVTYDAMGKSTAYTVSRTLKKPDVPIEVKSKRIGTISAATSGGTSFTSVLSTWGEPDQIEDYTVAAVIPGRNYTYLSQGLLFVTQASVLDSTAFKVTGIVVFDPYYGKMDVGSGLGVRSTRAELDAALSTASCQPGTSSFLNQSWRVYRYSGSGCDTRVGVVFDAQNRARMVWLGFPSGV